MASGGGRGAGFPAFDWQARHAAWVTRAIWRVTPHGLVHLDLSDHLQLADGTIGRSGEKYDRSGQEGVCFLSRSGGIITRARAARLGRRAGPFGWRFRFGGMPVLG